MADFPLTPAGVPLRAETKLLTCVQDHFQLVPIPETCPPDLVSSRPGVLETWCPTHQHCLRKLLHPITHLLKIYLGLKLKEFH